LHDVGKIGVSDTILLKPGKLTAEELEQMQHHCEYGGNIIAPMTDAEWGELLGQPNRTFEIIGNSSAPLMRLAALIALTHHEKWDGTGYPFGLHGEQIPLVGRITAIADVFDALSSERPYKEAFSVEKCFSIIREGRGNHFDPAVLDAFFDAEDEILAIKESLSD
jgi:putative two-component system response regulator